MSQRQNSATLIVKLLAMAIPVILGLYWPLFAIAHDSVGLLLRPAMLACAALMCICLFGHALTRAEMQMTRVFALMWLVLLLTSLAADNVALAFLGSFKLFLIQLFCLMLCRALRHEPSALVLGRWMLVCSLFITAFIVVVYLRMMGPVLPTYSAVRAMKGIAERQDIPLNATPATAMLAFLCAMCVRPMTRGMWVAGALVVLVGSLLTGSRAALTVPVIAGLVLLFATWIQSRNLWRRSLGWILSVCALGGAATAIALASSRVLVSATEGRWDLWRAGIAKFSERPLLGWGFLSWKSDLVSRLPGEYRLTSGLARHIIGGYHNQFVAALSEHGVVGFCALITLYAFAIASTGKLAFRNTTPGFYGKAALFGMLLILLRANVELDGFFGFSQDPADYATYIFLALVISRLSIEETRAPVSVPSWSAIAATASHAFDSAIETPALSCRPAPRGDV